MSNKKKPINTEEPTRIKKFLHTLQGIKWSDDNRINNLNNIFDALNELALNDLEYYNEKKQEHGKTSNRTRQTSLILGTLGALAMILQSFKPMHLFIGFICSTNEINISPSDITAIMTTIGSVCFTVAAAALAWNRLFGASGGHIRYVMAQFDLGESMVEFTLDWQKWLNRNRHNPPDNINVEEAFMLFKKFSEHTYSIVREETQIWGKSLMDAMDEQYKMSQKHK